MFLFKLLLRQKKAPKIGEIRLIDSRTQTSMLQTMKHLKAIRML